jgi:hypothetical protein
VIGAGPFRTFMCPALTSRGTKNSLGVSAGGGPAILQWSSEVVVVQLSSTADAAAVLINSIAVAARKVRFIRLAPMKSPEWRFVLRSPGPQC